MEIENTGGGGGGEERVKTEGEMGGGEISCMGIVCENTRVQAQTSVMGIFSFFRMPYAFSLSGTHQLWA